MDLFSERYDPRQDAECSDEAWNVLLKMLDFDVVFQVERRFNPQFEDGDVDPAFPSDVPKWNPGIMYRVGLPVELVGRRPDLRDLILPEMTSFPCTRNGGVLEGQNFSSGHTIAELEGDLSIALPYGRTPRSGRILRSTTQQEREAMYHYRVTSRTEGKFCLEACGLARTLNWTYDHEQFCPFCPNFRSRDAEHLIDHCLYWDHRSRSFPKLCSPNATVHEDDSVYLCGEVWDMRHMRRIRGVERSSLLNTKRYGVASAHRGFGMWFKSKYYAVVELWERLLKKKYVVQFAGQEAWDIVNLYLGW